MNALMLLKTDHRTVAQLFDEILGTKAKAKKQSLIKRIIKELSIHAAVEEQVFYPAVRDAVEDAEDEVLEALEEHHIVKWVLSELEKMTPDDERFDAKVKVLCENVTHHVKEEETKLFKLVRAHMDRRALEELGRAMAAARKVAPTHPHPRAPDAPPGNFVAGIGAGMIDRARDAVRGLAKAEPRPRRGASGRSKKTSASRTTRTRRSPRSTNR